MHGVKLMYNEEGFKGLYRGFLGNLAIVDFSYEARHFVGDADIYIAKYYRPLLIN